MIVEGREMVKATNQNDVWNALFKQHGRASVDCPEYAGKYYPAASRRLVRLKQVGGDSYWQITTLFAILHVLVHHPTISLY
jgi:hypothetical protein